MHFRRHGTRHAARDRVLGPITVTPDLVGEIIDDREAVPNDGFSIPQDWHLARRWCKICLTLALFPVRRKQRHDDLFKMEARLLRRKPAAQRPA